MSFARLSAAVLLALTTTDANRPVAIVYSLTGQATLQARGETARAVQLFDRLAAGTAVEVGSSSRLALAFLNGRRYALGEGSKVTLGTKDLDSRGGPVRLLPSVPPLPRLSPIAAEDRPGPKAGAVRVRGERITGLYPRDGATTLAPGTVLRFQPVSGAEKYRLEIHDEQGRTVFRAETEDREAAVPKGILRPGTRYSWIVHTVDRVGSVARGEARFRTLSAPVAEARAALRATLAAEGDGEAFALMAGIDRSLGMLQEARQALQAALAKSPRDPALAEALTDLERRLSESVLAPDGLALHEQETRLAKALAADRRWPEADAAWEVAVQRLEQKSPAGAAQVLREWGKSLVQRDAWDRAEACYRRALRLEPEESLAAARSLSALGTLARYRGNLAAAEERFREALDIRQKLAPESLDFASSVSDLAILAARRGDLVAASKGFGEALELQQRLAPDGMEVAGTLINLGNVSAMQGNLDTSSELFRRAIVLIERLSPEDPELARALNCLAQDESWRGELALAEEHFRRALEIRRKLAPESLSVAAGLQNLGILAEKRGNCAEAEEIHRRALDIRERLAPDSPHVAESLANLGIAEACRGEHAKADEHFRRALALYESSSPESFNATAMRIERARVAVLRGDLALAEELFGRVLLTLEKQAPGGIDAADAQFGLGTIALERGELTRAEDLFRRAAAIFDQLAPASTRLGQAQNAMGRVHRRASRPESAAEHFCRAAETLDRQRKKLGGTPESRSAFSGTTAEPYRDCLGALIDLGRTAEAFHVLERGRARSFLDLLAERNVELTAELPPELVRDRRQTNAELDRIQAALARLSPARDQAEMSRLQVELRDLRFRHEEIAAKIRLASPKTAALQDPQPLDLAGAREALDPGTVLLTWSIGKERSFLFVVEPAGTPGPGLEIFPLDLTDAALREKVETFRHLLQNSGSDAKPLFAQAAELYGALLQPAEARIARSERLLISPDGPLHTLPFGALIRNGRYLTEDKPIHSIVSATVYAELRRSRRLTPSLPPVDLIAFGDPTYPPLPSGQATSTDPEVRAAVGRGLALAPLPGSREEVLGLAALFPRARTLLGIEATEERAKALEENARYLHFACHGLLDDRFPLNSALALTIPENPGEGEDNGLLQAWEIFESVRIDADLVTLSACDTALGREMGGEGLVGLTRAFQYAGARSVLASLWSVSDVATADLMQRFYGHLRAGKPKAEALQAATTELIRSPGRKHSHPYHWAAFQLLGDWR